MSVSVLPSNREEEWRWSYLGAIPALEDAQPSGRLPDELPWVDCDPAGPRLLFVDGRLDAARSLLGPVEIGRVDVEAADHPLASRAGKEGWRLRLGRDHAPGGLVQILNVSTGASDQLASAIDLDVDAQASILETFVGDGWTNRLTGIRLAKGARLMLHRRLIGTTGLATLTDRAIIGTGSSLVTATLAAGAADSRTDARVELAGEQAYAEASAALLARGRQRHDANFIVHHGLANGVSRQIWRSVADDQSACSVAARVEVARHAQKTDAEQSIKGLLLARSATINAKPELEIFADDVKCAHGATVGQLDPASLFYLESRGVTTDEARALLTRAFVADAIDRVGEGKLRDLFYEDAQRWFA